MQKPSAQAPVVPMEAQRPHPAGSFVCSQPHPALADALPPTPMLIPDRAGNIYGLTEDVRAMLVGIKVEETFPLPLERAEYRVRLNSLQRALDHIPTADLKEDVATLLMMGTGAAVVRLETEIKSRHQFDQSLSSGECNTFAPTPKCRCRTSLAEQSHLVLSTQRLPRTTCISVLDAKSIRIRPILKLWMRPLCETVGSENPVYKMSGKRLAEVLGAVSLLMAAGHRERAFSVVIPFYANERTVTPPFELVHLARTGGSPR